jgi:hypothetical protein
VSTALAFPRGFDNMGRPYYYIIPISGRRWVQEWESNGKSLVMYEDEIEIAS